MEITKTRETSGNYIVSYCLDRPETAAPKQTDRREQSCPQTGANYESPSAEPLVLMVCNADFIINFARAAWMTSFETLLLEEAPVKYVKAQF